MKAQDFIMQDGSVNTCAGNFFDSGGANNDYSDNENFVYTICPDLVDYKLVAEFIEIDFITTSDNSGDDKLVIYDGQDVNSPILYTIDQNNNIDSTDSSLIIIASESNASGCLTFKFTSDFLFNSTGWNAQIDCIESCQDSTASLTHVIPSIFNNASSNYEIEIFQNINVEIDPNFTGDNGNNPSFIWDFGDGSAPQTTSQPVINYVYSNLGEFDISVTIVDDIGCTNEDILEIPIEVFTPLNSFCDDASEICFDESAIIIPNFNQNDDGIFNAEDGPDYGCLATQPDPSWFYFQVENSGDLTFLLEQNTLPDLSGTSLDLDFKIWGPFSSPFGNCNNLNTSTELPDLPNGNIFDGCSFSAFASENMGVSNAQAGEYYIFITTNFSQQNGFIRIEQTNLDDPNAGSIFCDENTLLGSDLSICGDESITLTSSITNGDSFTWEILNINSGLYEVLNGETSPNLIVSPPGGTYRLTINSGTDVFQDEITVGFFQEPVVTQAPNNLSTCTDNANTTFDLTINNLNSLGITNPNEFDIYYFDNEQDAISGDIGQSITTSQNYTFDGDFQDIYIRIQNISNQACHTIVSFTIEKNINPEFNQPGPLEVCGDDNGFAIFDLTTATPIIVGNLENAVSVSYYETQSDAISNINQIVGVTNYISDISPKTIYFRVEDLNTSCFSVGSLELIIDDCLSINDNLFNAIVFKLYQNPTFNNIIFLESEYFSNSSKGISVFNINGKLVYSTKIDFDASGKAKLNLESLASGVYLLEVSNKNSNIVKKIVLN